MVPVTPGNSYTLSCWYKWAAYQEGDWGFDTLTVNNYNWSEAGSIDGLHTLYPQNTWSYVELTFTPSTSFVRIDFGQAKARTMAGIASARTVLTARPGFSVTA